MHLELIDFLEVFVNSWRNIETQDIAVFKTNEQFLYTAVLSERDAGGLVAPCFVDNALPPRINTSNSKLLIEHEHIKLRRFKR